MTSQLVLCGACSKAGMAREEHSVLWDCSLHSHTKADVSCGRNSEVEEQFVGNAAGQAGREGVLVGVGTV